MVFEGVDLVSLLQLCLGGSGFDLEVFVSLCPSAKARAKQECLYVFNIPQAGRRKQSRGPWCRFMITEMWGYLLGDGKDFSL